MNMGEALGVSSARWHLSSLLMSCWRKQKPHWFYSQRWNWKESQAQTERMMWSGDPGRVLGTWKTILYGQLPVFINKILLDPRHAHLLTSIAHGCFPATKAELSSHNSTLVDHVLGTIWLQSQKYLLSDPPQKKVWWFLHRIRVFYPCTINTPCRGRLRGAVLCVAEFFF